MAECHRLQHRGLTLDVLPDKEVVHDVLSVVLEDLLKLVNVVVLVGHDQVRHGQDLGVILVRLGLLRVERVDVGLHQPGKKTMRWCHDRQKSIS